MAGHVPIVNSITPGRNRVVVIADKPEEKNKAGLLIPESERKIPNHGKLISVGHITKEFEHLNTIKPGAKVLWLPEWEQRKGYEVRIKDVPHYIFHIELILGECTASTK